MRSSPLLARIGAAALCLAAALPVSAQEISERLVEYKLDNGMTFLVYPREGAPVFAATTSVSVAGVDEVYGETGVAHMFEHMAFKGTHRIGTTNLAAELPIMEEMDRLAEEARAELGKNQPDRAKVEELRAGIRKLQEQQAAFIVKDEFDSIMQREGATGINASTSADFTNYYASLPSNKLELWFWLEADRMRQPIMREFYSERDVVREERRQRTDDSPFGLLYEKFTTTVFAAHPYGKPIIGWESDIESITRPMAEEFRKKFYGPRSVAVAIVGNVDPEEVKRLADKYFGTWDAPGAPQRLAVREPAPRAEARVSVEFDAEPSMIIGWLKPTSPSDDDAAFTILGSVLGDGRTSRFYRALVVEKQMAVSVDASNGTPGDKYMNAFAIFATPKAPHSVFDLEKEIYAILEEVAENGVTERELERARNNVEAGFIRLAGSNMGLATTLAQAHHQLGDARLLEQERDRLLAVTSEDIQRVVKQYLTRNNRTVAWLERPEAAQ
ncbi:MAG: pitrilysin family protein [Candidatus Sumerlaeia bacterium]|nr:pitrilysin family protein [Candidatus Sumerlaeia bacterium]